MKKITILGLIIILGFLSACKPEDNTPYEKPENYVPAVYGLDDVEIKLYTDFDPLLGVTAYDYEDGDIEDIEVTGTIDNTQLGTYQLTYKVTDSEGAVGSYDRFITVVELGTISPSGFIDLSNEPDEVQYAYVKAVEKYIFNNLYGGIPLYTEKYYYNKTNRLDISNSNGNIANHNFNNLTLTEDDSNVLMQDGNLGNASEYTFRDYTVGAYNGFNHLNKYYGPTLLIEYENYEITTKFVSSIYNRELVDGVYTYTNGLAKSEPTPVDPDYTYDGRPYSTKWIIEIEDDLMWKFHPNVYSAFLDTNPDHNITAQDIVDSLKVSIDNGWYSDYGTVLNLVYQTNLIDYIESDTAWEDTGFYAQGNDLVIELKRPMLMSELYEVFSSILISPINTDLYNYINDNYPDNFYGDTKEMTAYSGEYYVEDYLDDDYILFKKNEHYQENSDNNYTGYLYYLRETLDIEEIYETGLIDLVVYDLQYTDSNFLSSEEVEYQESEHMTKLNLNYNYTLFENDFIKHERLFLKDLDFRKAVYYAIDREKLTTNVLSGFISEEYYFSDDFKLENTIHNYREIVPISDIEGDLFNTETSHDELATEYFKKAIDSMIESEYIDLSYVDYGVTFNFDILVNQDNKSAIEAARFIEDRLEALLVDEERDFHVNIDIHFWTQENVNNSPGIFNQVDMNLGFDTNYDLFTYANEQDVVITPNYHMVSNDLELQVELIDDLGNTYYEMWSYNALVDCLNGNTFVYDGTIPLRPSIEVVETTPTTIKVEVLNYQPEIYSNLTLTLYEESYITGITEVENYVDIVYQDEFIIFEGLNPLNETYVPMEEYSISGFYTIELNYNYRVNENEEYTTRSTTIMTESLIQVESMPTLFGDYYYEVLINEALEDIDVESIVLYELNNDGTYFESTLSTEYITKNGVVVIYQMQINTRYVLEINLDNGYTHYHNILEY